MTFGNVTIWNRKCQERLRETDAQVVLLAELHLAGEKLLKARDDEMPRLGWRATISPALATSRGGLSGGTGVFVRSHLHVHFLDSVERHLG